MILEAIRVHPHNFWLILGDLLVVEILGKAAIYFEAESQRC
ncbi:hypothetical protein [Sodalis-like endosymbiont of Proechinophthirus fluctus]|nr:hypothetical protein [Sodalis-like endosymbiont of Proechinophthirus fluctus]